MYDLYKHPEYGHVKSNDSYPTPTGRIVWPALVTPKPGFVNKAEGGKPAVPRYEATLLLEKENPKTGKFIETMIPLIKEMVALYNKDNKTKIVIDDFLQDGDGFDMEKYPYYKGCFVIPGRNPERPRTINSKAEDIPADDIKGGMLGAMMVAPIVTAKGVSFRCEVVQLVKDDGTRFGSSGKNTQKLVDALPTYDADGNEIVEKTEPGIAGSVAGGKPPEEPKQQLAPPQATQKGMKAALARL